jgi:hypothetical protein
MPRPQTKKELIDASQKEHDELDRYLQTLTPEQFLEPDIVGVWTVKDVIAHLYEWEQMVLSWWAAGQAGKTPHVPAEGYKWSQLPALNEMIRQKHESKSTDQVLELYHHSYQQIMNTIESIPEETLFTSGLYPWMNKNTLASYFISSTSSHYRWALKEIKKGFRAKQKTR